MSTNTQKVKGAIALRKEQIKLGFIKDEEEQMRWKWFPCRGGVIKNQDLVAYASKAAHIPESALAMATEALFDAISYYCLNGHSVQVPSLGTFGLQLNSKCVADEEGATAETITKKYIRFWPKKEVREQCNLKNINLKVSD